METRFKKVKYLHKERNEGKTRSKYWHIKGGVGGDLIFRGWYTSLLNSVQLSVLYRASAVIASFYHLATWRASPMPGITSQRSGEEETVQCFVMKGR
jgi:hypothetical protein